MKTSKNNFIIIFLVLVVLCFASSCKTPEENPDSSEISYEPSQSEQQVEKKSFILVRFDQSVNRAINYAIADDLLYPLKNGTFHLSMDCLWSEIISGKLVLKEHEDARWLTREKLDDVQWLPADITLIEKLKSIIRLSKEKKYGQVFN